ncbi:response regulator [Sphingomonas koreensis]|nr:response regulator [Sphingomonas koreensis]
MTTDTILFLVEDEILIQQMLEDALTDAGFKVVIAGNGAEAITELGDDATRFCAVVTDIRLGAGPSGWDVGQRTRELVHDMPIVYMSGDSGHEWASKGVPNSIMVGKPFAPAQIVTAVATLMNEVSSHPGTSN